MSRTRISAFAAALLLTASLSPLPAFAQYDDSETETEAAHGGNATAAARLQVRISELEEQVRKLQGAMEQISFNNKQLKTQLDKIHADTDYRLQALEKNPAAPAPAAAAPTPGEPSPAATTNLNEEAAPAAEPNKYKPAPAAAPANKTVEAPASGAAIPQFASSYEHYSYAFKLMNQTKYAEAGNAFTAFTQRYPKDPLIGHAYFWLGDSYYVRQDYVKAADSFRQGYEAMPAGPKAADNLLKLAMTLNNLGKDKESCVVLKQVNTKFAKGSATVKSRVETAMNDMDCK